MKTILKTGVRGTIALLFAATLPAAQAEEPMKDPPPAMPSAEMNKLVAVIRPVADSNVKGTVLFEKAGEGVKVTAKVGGLGANAKHGIHIHEFGDLGSDDATSAGDHFNPGGSPHALPDESDRHAGDLGNLQADGDGNATLVMIVTNITLDSGKRGILGRAVIIHAKADDGGQPSGNAGDRIGAGVIGISKDAKADTTTAATTPPDPPPVAGDRDSEPTDGEAAEPGEAETRPTQPDSDAAVQDGE